MPENDADSQKEWLQTQLFQLEEANRILGEELSRFRNSHEVLIAENDRLRKQLSERLQQLEELRIKLGYAEDAAAKGDEARSIVDGLRMAERLNVETVSALQKERDQLLSALEHGRVAMRDLWRLHPDDLPSDDLERRCKAFIGGG